VWTPLPSHISVWPFLSPLHLHIRPLIPIWGHFTPWWGPFAPMSPPPGQRVWEWSALALTGIPRTGSSPYPGLAVWAGWWIWKPRLAAPTVPIWLAEDFVSQVILYCIWKLPRSVSCLFVDGRRFSLNVPPAVRTSCVWHLWFYAANLCTSGWVAGVLLHSANVMHLSSCCWLRCHRILAVNVIQHRSVASRWSTACCVFIFTMCSVPDLDSGGTSCGFQ